MPSHIARLLMPGRVRDLAAWVVLAVVALWLLAPYLRGGLLRLRHDEPYLIEFGRGSGWHGLDTITVHDDGSVRLHRQVSFNPRNAWETATLTLPADALARVRHAVEQHRLRDLQPAYDGGNRSRAGLALEWVCP